MNETTPTYQPMQVSIEDSFGPYPALVDPTVRWHGWLCPRFDRDTVRRIADDTRRAAETDEETWVVHLDEASGVAEVRYPQWLEWEGWDPEVYVPDADGLYSIGAGSWVWAEAQERAAAADTHSGSHPRPADPDEIANLRGSFAEGYTAEDINHAFGVVHEVHGRTLLCRWEVFDGYGYGGNSQFYFQEADAYYYDAGVYEWLSGHRDGPLGDPVQWRGAPVPDTDNEGPQHAETEDGFHNCALIDENAS